MRGWFGRCHVCKLTQSSAALALLETAPTTNDGAHWEFQKTLRDVEVTSTRIPSGIKNVTIGGRHAAEIVTVAEMPSRVPASSMRTLPKSAGVDEATNSLTAARTCVDVS